MFELANIRRLPERSSLSLRPNPNGVPSSSPGLIASAIYPA